MATPSSSMPRTSQLLAQVRLEEIDRLVETGEKTIEEVAEERKELEKKAGRKWRLNLWLLLGILLAAALVAAVIRALPEEGGLLWLFTIPPPPEEVGETASVLAPLLAVAVAIERLLETIFGWYEQSVRAVSEVVATVRKPIDWIERELKEAYKAAEEAARKTGVAADEASLKALDLAEQRLAKAEKRLLSWVKAPEYVAWKRALSIWVGLFVGLEVAVLGDLGMLHTIGVPAPHILDMLATGLVIGAGPGPVHSIMGILQGGKDALEKQRFAV
jgi:hypothetical protein